MTAHEAAKLAFDLTTAGAAGYMIWSNARLRRQLAETQDRRNEWRELWFQVSADHRKAWRALVRACGSVQAAQAALAAEDTAHLPRRETAA